MISISSEPLNSTPMKAAGKAGDDDQHGVAEDMAIEHAPFGQALGTRRQHILLADLLEEGVLGQHGSVAKPPITMAMTGSAMCQT